MTKPNPDQGDPKPTDQSAVRSAVENAGSPKPAEDESGKKPAEGQQPTGQNDQPNDEGKPAGGDSAGDEGGAKPKGDAKPVAKADDAKPGDEPKRRFSQFEGESIEDYIQNLEKAYISSSDEGVRLGQKAKLHESQIQAILSAATKDPDLAQRLNGILGQSGQPAQQPAPAAGQNDQGAPQTGQDGQPSPLKDPMLANAEYEWNQKATEEFNEFAESNPELLSDPETNRKVNELVGDLSRITYQREGRIISMSEALNKAYVILGLDDKSKSKVAQTAKTAAARPSPQNSGSKKAKPDSKEFSDEALSLAQKMGKDEGYLKKFAQ